MGKNLKGKEIGKGLCQRKDGRYQARYVNRLGKRCTKYFTNVPEARNWLEEARYLDKHNNIPMSSDLTVDQWYDIWSTNVVGDAALNTRRIREDRYRLNIQSVIGQMPIADVKPMHCKQVFRLMEDHYSGSTMQQAYVTMGTLFKSAAENDLISKNPMVGVKFAKPIRQAGAIKFFTREEQVTFLEVAKTSSRYEQFALLLETGLRSSELVGLTWDAIDLKNRTLTVNKTLNMITSEHSWYAAPPKTSNGYRTIPLTDTAHSILDNLWQGRGTRKESAGLLTDLPYLDLRTGKQAHLDMRELVFLDKRSGSPIYGDAYNTTLYRICEKARVPKISMHALRHTYATRAIESGVQPVVLQHLLGHSSIKTTMDCYVHVSEDSLQQAVKTFQENGVKLA